MGQLFNIGTTYKFMLDQGFEKSTILIKIQICTNQHLQNPNFNISKFENPRLRKIKFEKSDLNQT